MYFGDDWRENPIYDGIMDGKTWLKCPVCQTHFKPGKGQEPKCTRCEFTMTVEDVLDQTN